ncbi:metal-dependent transcriptional regulator [Cryobacterium sp. BB307]|uniref:metal-dependent transcriptional regulator n=1 Tax=Cryobacterium sp. BB307 TaxID=2716317 RepID=UPI00144688CD|nr:metal-dependent transcriptional regulator [Cryobacterium sp. BB307]
MTDLIDTTEMYLRTIYELEEEHIIPLRARISERLGHSGPTVSQTIGRMERDGLVVVENDRQLRLTQAGRSKAVNVMRKHRLAERLLADVIGLDWALVHEEACRWEHVMSEQVERRIIELLQHPTHSPYGNPIPGLSDLGENVQTGAFSDGVVNLVNFVHGAVGAQTGEVKRLGEPVQYEPEVLEQLRAAGLVPGAHASFTSTPGYVHATVEGSDQSLELPTDVAQHIYVAVTPKKTAG